MTHPIEDPTRHVTTKNKVHPDNITPKRSPKTTPPAPLIIEAQSEPKKQHITAGRMTTTKIGHHDSPKQRPVGK